MRHPDLPDHDLLRVVRSQVPPLAACGWVEVEEPKQPVPDPEPEKKSRAGDSKPTPKKDAAASQGGK
jgi:hypothetical protein